ncbi:MAG: hypothetical protein Fur0043_08570 [Anaerolineales bacterium]
MRKWLWFALTWTLLFIPFSANAQGGTALETAFVQLWPEFDQTNMLVIYDLRVAQGVTLPQTLNMRVPAEAQVIAVAQEQDGALFNVPYQETAIDAAWKQVTLTLEATTTYHLEYYAPLQRDGLQRKFVYLWPGDYAVASLTVSLRLPLDTTKIDTQPTMSEMPPTGDGATYLQWSKENLQAGQQEPLEIVYTKTTERLSASTQSLEPGAVNEKTPGRVSLSNYYPYILGGLGILLIAGGGIYFWQSSKSKPAPRRHRHTQAEENDREQVHCHQCGKRAQPGDRFCRACGTRLRRE